MDVEVGLSLLLRGLHGDGARGQGDGVGQSRLAVVALQIHRHLHDAGVDVLAAAEAALGHVHIGLHQLHRENADPVEEAGEELGGIAEPEGFFMDEKAG